MSESGEQFYVYVYIDPRNFQAFYYGKGQGSRQFSHLLDSTDCEKTTRINEMRKEGLEPIIRVVAKGLTEEQALLVEKTLIWSSRGLSNVATGHFGDKFRPLNTLHRRLPDFDYRNQIHYFNVGDGKHRSWEDNVKYCYLGAGQGKAFRDAIRGLHPGDIVVARLNKVGYVGIGRVMSEATPARDFRVPKFAASAQDCGKLLVDLGLKPAIKDHLIDDIKCEYMVAVKWIRTVGRSKGYWEKNAGLFAQRGITRASLANQRRTIQFVQRCFGVNLEELANENEEILFEV
ncbi:MAG TPA: GIY-YIG nuclease family protein [Terriglobales bacterium]|nr:GIY-YIG nuclease family protein [Terriglobales bacterium]